MILELLVIPFVKKKSEITPLNEFLKIFLVNIGFTSKFFVKLFLLFSISKCSIFKVSSEFPNELYSLNARIILTSVRAKAGGVNAISVVCTRPSKFKKVPSFSTKDAPGKIKFVFSKEASLYAAWHTEKQLDGNLFKKSFGLSKPTPKKKIEHYLNSFF